MLFKLLQINMFDTLVCHDYDTLVTLIYNL